MGKVYQFKTLLGHKNLEFSIACLRSFMEKSMDNIRLVIFEDGTITDADVDKLRSNLSNLTIVYKAERDIIVNEKLRRFPHCMRYRNRSAYAQKLLDVMLCDGSDLFFIDSDVYFIRRFRLPRFSHLPAFIRDSQNAYSFNPSQFIGIRFPIIGRVNTGLFFFPFEHYNLDFLEMLLSDSVIQSGSDRLFWLEQTLWAFLAGRVSENQYFDDTQIRMAERELSIDERTVAVHLVSTFRFQFEYLKSLTLPEQDSEEHIRLLNGTKALKKYEFAVDRIRKGISRRIDIFR